MLISSHLVRYPTGTMLVLGDGVDRVDDPRKIGEEGEQEAEPELDLPSIEFF